MSDGSAPSGSPSEPADTDRGAGRPGDTGDGGGGSGGDDGDDAEAPALEELFDELEALEETVDRPEERRRVREAISLAMRIERRAFGRVISGFDRSDAAESLLGSLLFGIPMFVEGGTQEIGEFLATRPFWLGGTILATVGTVVGILYVADFQDVRIRDPILGIFPRKLTGVLLVSGVTAAVVMTGWGRVDWGEPRLAVATVVVAWFPMAIGAALGDILPGS